MILIFISSFHYHYYFIYYTLIIIIISSFHYHSTVLKCKHLPAPRGAAWPGRRGVALRGTSTKLLLLPLIFLLLNISIRITAITYY